MKAVLVLISAITFAASPFFFPDFGGFDPNRYPVPQNDPPVQPAGWAFSIWGIIYLALIGHGAFGLLKHRDDKAWDNGRWALFVSLAVGTAWLGVALHSPIWATILIWAMLISALMSLMQMKHAEPRWQAGWPVALYAGWLSAASFVSIGLLLAGYDFTSGFTAAIIALVLASVFTAYFQLKIQHWTYGIAVAWGFLGIAINNLGSQPIITAAASVATLLMLGLAARQIRTQTN